MPQGRLLLPSLSSDPAGWQLWLQRSLAQCPAALPNTRIAMAKAMKAAKAAPKAMKAKKAMKAMKAMI